MTAAEYLSAQTQHLRQSGIETARLDCLILLEDELGISRAHLLAHGELQLSAGQLGTLNKKIAQRAKHIPLAYIRGKTAFFGREFMVDRRVLVPRPESEAIIELLKTLPLGDHVHIADIGTGSGCLGITAALELPGATVQLCDISAGALSVANQNARQLGAHVISKQQDLLGNKPANYDVVLANLPYVPDNFPVNQAVRSEPAQALFAGVDGLDLYKKLWRQLADSRHRPRFVLTESFANQHHALATLARHAGYALERSSGLAQLFAQ